MASLLYFRALAVLWFLLMVTSALAMWLVGFWLRYAPVIALSLAVVLVLTVARIAAMGVCP